MLEIQQLERRRFLFKTTKIAIAVGATSILMQACSAGEKNNTSHSQVDFQATISELAFLLLPLQNSDSKVYGAVPGQLMMNASRSPGAESLITQGIAALNAPVGNAWLSLSPQARQESVQKLYNTPFIGMVRWATQEVLLRDPAIWQQLGYQGSSIEHGGYLHRGFDDIDWLPSAAGSK